jgi:hypothetical protein
MPSGEEMGGFLFWLLSGVLYGIAGVIASANPLLAALALTTHPRRRAARLRRPARLVGRSVSARNRLGLTLDLGNHHLPGRRRHGH